MKQSVSLIRLNEAPVCTLALAKPEIPQAIDDRARDIWREEMQRRGSGLFDGEIVSVVSIADNRITGRRADYRYLLAQSRDPSIFRWSQVRPLAVTGLLFCQDGIVIGHLSQTVYQYPGMGELAPSGSVDMSTLGHNQQVDLRQQLMLELQEEIGITTKDVSDVQPLAVVSDNDSQVFDVCYTVRTSLQWEDIQRIFKTSGSAEYEQLELLPLNRIQDYLLANQKTLTPLTLALLQMASNDQSMPGPETAATATSGSGRRTAIIVQARRGSSRLPGKILQRLNGKTVLEHVLERLHKVKNADMVVVATTTQPADDEVATLAQRCGATVFRGDEHDVLSRYLGAARAVDADVILRVTSDCPLIDPELCEAVIAARGNSDADYTSNNMPRLFPHGLDCEAFTRTALEMAARDATSPYDREHVTPWMRRAPELRRSNVIGPGWPARLQRWTLDYPEDLDFFRKLFALFPDGHIPTWQEALSIIGTSPELSLANAKHRVRSAMANDPAANIIVCRMVANARIGTGHAMRCLALLTRLEALGWRCLWAASEETFAFLGSNIPPEGRITLGGHDMESDAAEISRAVGKCDVLLIDDYDVDIAFARASRSFAGCIVYFDDLANRKMDADIIVNPTPGDWETRYEQINAHRAHLLVGPAAALLRQQFQPQRATKGRATDHTSASSKDLRVLVAFGGVDPLNGTGLALEMLKDFHNVSVDVVLGSRAPYIEQVKQLAASLGPRVSVWTDVADMASMMMRADISIGAPGTSTWERACVGLPTILVGIAENQRENAAIVEQIGAGICAGFLTTDDRARVGAKLKDLFAGLGRDEAARKAMSEAAFSLCDGRGAQRIIAALLPKMHLRDGRTLSLRVVEAQDEQMLMDLQRAPETRRYALNPAIPTAEEHHRWLMERLSAAADWFLIAEVDGQPGAFVRADWIGEDNGRPEYLISIATERRFHRCGVGAALLKAVRYLAPGAHFYAKILPDNVASLALFAKADYRLAADGYFHAYPPQHKEA